MVKSNTKDSNQLIWVDASQDERRGRAKDPQFEFVQETGGRRSVNSLDATRIRSHVKKSRRSCKDPKGSQSRFTSLVLENEIGPSSPTRGNILGREGPRSNGWPVQQSAPLICFPQWLFYASSDPLILQATALYSRLITRTGSIAHTNPHDGHFDQQLLQIRGQIIRMVQNRLNDPRDPSRNATLAAIAILAISETLNADDEASYVHIAGLRGVILARGGAASLRADEMLRRLVTWANLCQSVLSQRIPQPLLLNIYGDEICQGPDFPDPIVIKTIPYMTIELLSLTKSRQLSQDAADIFCYLRRLSRVKDLAHFMPGFGDGYKDHFLDWAEYHTSRLLLGSQVNTRHSFRWMIHAFSLAANIYIYAVLREISRSAPYFRILAKRMKETLEQADPRELQADTSGKRIWILFVGRLAANGGPEDSWFGTAIARIMEQRGLDTRHAIDLVMAESLWPRVYRGMKWVDIIKLMMED
ncbi:hypothetical protein BP6252_11128 [Coleophoma cylindrospora]|uniref:Uncharacterized protein n=1 Tax=Coleophoma cylindrospora TaxID=1849047 RepID=A0A3D8QP33_9HELO|nr:hypothetical protein BP6252_11128 [Coleophoma cylindrospora]